MCAILDIIYILETITFKKHIVLFKIIRLRIKEPGNGILTRLKDISALYLAVMNNNLPIGDLSIESSDDHTPFKEVVYCGK